MDTNNNKAMNVQRQRDDFHALWGRRKHTWREQAERTMPDDANLLRLSEIARRKAQLQEAEVVPITRRRNRWIPYAAAASLVIGVAAIGLNRHTKVDDTMTPVAQEVDIDGNTMFFLCNNGCSVQDVMLAANDVIKK